MKLRTCLIIISAVCCLDTYARLHKELTRDQLIRILRRIPVPENDLCSRGQAPELLFATLIIDGDIFDLFCYLNENEIYFYAMTPLRNLDGSKETLPIKVLYNNANQTLKYKPNSSDRMNENLDDKNYELEPVETSHVRTRVRHLPHWPIIAYKNKVAPQPLKRDLDRIWTFLKQHCQNTRPVCKHLIIITMDGLKIQANFDCALQKAQIQERILAGQLYILDDTEGPSHISSFDYSLETGEFSPATAWGVLQILQHTTEDDPVNPQDEKQIIELEKIRFPLQIFVEDLLDIRNEMLGSRNSQTDAAKSKSTLEERQKIISNGSGGVVVNGKVLMEIKRYTTNKANGGDASMIKIHAPTLAPKNEVYLSDTGFKRTSILKGWKVLRNIKDYYIQGSFFKEWPEYSSEYVDMRFVRNVLTESLEEPKEGLKQNKNENCVQTAYFVYQKRLSLQTKVDVCERVIELQDLEVLRLKQAGGGLEAFKTFYDLGYFLQNDFATKDGALEDALCVRLKPFDESSCTECVLMHRYNTHPDDWTIYQSSS